MGTLTIRTIVYILDETRTLKVMRFSPFSTEIHLSYKSK